MSAELDYAIGLARAAAGAIVFCVPLFMTMEMWSLGVGIDPLVLVQFTLVNLLVLVGLSRVSGFEETGSRTEDLLDALAAYAVAVLVTAAILALFGVIGPGMPAGEIVGKIAIQAVPASFGAMIANKQLGAPEESEQQERWRESYAGELFLMLAGALFLSFNMAPTEEMVLIAYQMSAGAAVLLVLTSILMLHLFVYSVGFAGQEERGEASIMAVLLRFTLPGYAIAVFASLYILWTFARLDGVHLVEAVAITAVLAFPAAIGAAIARLVV